MVTLHCAATSTSVVPLWQSARETESLHYRPQTSSSLWNFHHCRVTIVTLQTVCAKDFLLSLTSTKVNSCTELSHATKATKATLDKVLPCSLTGHTHTRSHAHTQTHKKKEKEGGRDRERKALLISHSLFDENEEWKRAFSAAISFALYCRLPHLSFCDIQSDGMLRERKPLILYVVKAKGNRATMLEIYHPWLGVCVCVSVFCVCVCVYVHGCVWHATSWGPGCFWGLEDIWVCLWVRLGFEVEIKVGFRCRWGPLLVCGSAPAEEHTPVVVDLSVYWSHNTHKANIDCPQHSDANRKILTGLVSGHDRSTLNRWLMLV